MSERNPFARVNPSELRRVYERLKSLQRTIIFQDTGDDGGEGLQDTVRFELLLVEIHKLMKTRLDGPQSVLFSDLTEDDLEKLNVVEAGRLKLKPKVAIDPLVAVVKAKGKNDVWSSENLYLHLQRLQTLVPKSNGTGARAWIDAIFFRASAMMPADKSMVLTEELPVPPTAVNSQDSGMIHGYIDFTAVVADKTTADELLFYPRTEHLKKIGLSSFVVTEAKLDDDTIWGHIPHAIGETLACAKALGKNFIRGAVTNGEVWVFFALSINSEGGGTRYWVSNSISFFTILPRGPERQITAPYPDIISGILASWMENSFDDIQQGDDWFTVVTR